MLAGFLVAVIPVIAGCGSSSSTTHLTSAASCASLYPSPGTHTASSAAQISLRDVAPGYLSSGAVTVTGSRTGMHRGRWVTDSDRQGASFYPTTAFNAGETVTVSAGVPICGAAGDSATFAVAIQPGPLAPDPPASATTTTPLDQPTTTYASLPGVKIPTLTVNVPGAFGNDDIFETPRGGTTPAGPIILNGNGQVVWFDQLPPGDIASDLSAQTYDGQPVLTWWQEHVSPSTGLGVDPDYVIMNSHYRIMKTVTAQNGAGSDEHEFLLSPSGTTAWAIGTNVIGANLTALGGPKNGPVVDYTAQEIDLATGNVLFEWHSLDHVPVTDSYFGYTPTLDYDYFHMNSIDPLANGTVLISSRNTHTVYAIDQRTGAVVWQLGGKHSTFTMGPGANFALQHDARMHGATTISIFDDEDAPPSTASGATPAGLPARAILLSLNFTMHTATLVRSITHNGLKVPWQGNEQILANGDVVVGWGSGGFTSIYSPAGTLLFDATWGSTINSYRAFLLPWSGTPTTPPSIAASSANGTAHVFASWNGSTVTTRWEVLGGSSRTNLHALASASRTGFQTEIALPSAPRLVQVVAENATGQALGTSAVIAPKPGAEPAVVSTP